MKDFIHIPRFFNKETATEWFNVLRDEIPWHKTVFAQDGTAVPLNRSMAYAAYPEYNPGNYLYAGLRLPSMDMTPTLEIILKALDMRWNYFDDDLIPEHPTHEFNSVLLNLYENGREEIRWHSDKEPQLGPTPVIATVNLGASRTFSLRHKETGERTDILLNNGDVLMMLEHCQQNYVHAVLKEKHVTEARISLTFRNVLKDVNSNG